MKTNELGEIITVNKSPTNAFISVLVVFTQSFNLLLSFPMAFDNKSFASLFVFTTINFKILSMTKKIENNTGRESLFSAIAALTPLPPEK